MPFLNRKMIVMTPSEIERIRRWFREYTDAFRTREGTLHPVLQLKMDHSLLVATDARDIARDLEWPETDIHTAEMLGLLHDIARFPQHREFTTLLDYLSFDHGERGFAIVRDSGILAFLPPAEASAILVGIRYHNRRDIPSAIAPGDLRFLHLVRDADKLDIFRIVRDMTKNKTYLDHPELLCVPDPDGPPAPALIAESLERGTGSYENVRSLADINLMRLTWLYHLNYLPTIRRVADRGYLDDLCRFLPDTPEIREITRRAYRFLEERLPQLPPAIVTRP